MREKYMEMKSGNFETVLGGRKKKDAILCASDDEVRCRKRADDKGIIMF